MVCALAPKLAALIRNAKTPCFRNPAAFIIHRILNSQRTIVAHAAGANDPAGT
jgi:hypothetical protein